MDESGLAYYLTRHPEVKISRRSQLENFHKKVRYMEMNLEDLDFGTKRRLKKYSFTEKSSVKRQKLPDINLQSNRSLGDVGGDVQVRSEVNVVESETDEMRAEEHLEENGPTFPGESLKVDQNWQWRSGIDSKEIEDGEGVDEEEVEDIEDSENKILTVSSTEKKNKAHLESEKIKLEKAVKKLTLNRDEAVDHNEALLDAANKLNKMRKSLGNQDLSKLDLDSIKSEILAAQTAEELVLSLKNSSELQILISNIVQSKILEQLMSISSINENPLNDFPMNINRNHYKDIIDFALTHAPDALGFVLKIATKNEAPIAAQDVIRCAFMFSTLACSVSRLNNALKKTKSVSTKSNGLTNTGLDVLALLGIFETSRTYRNNRDLLASISDLVLMSYAHCAAVQITFDNMDLTVGGVMHHMTLPFIEFEKEDTSHLSSEEKSFEEALEHFKDETVLITSEFNKALFKHYNYVTAWTLAQLLGEEVEGFSWLKAVFPKQFEHPNVDTSSMKSIIFIQKPLNFSENNNNDMIKIMETLQWKFLSLVGEQAKDRESYFADLTSIYSVELDKDIREESEERIKEQVKVAGELILHGDLLTDVRFETCKRMRRMAVTAVERFDYLKIFRLGTFHLQMNKIIQDVKAGMKSEVNVEDIISLGYFKTTLGLHHITNNPDVIKKDGNYECHSQFCDDIGSELLIEAFKTFVENESFKEIYEDPIEKTEETAVTLLLDFLKTMDIKYYYDPESFEEKNVHDDMMSSAKDNAARTLISLVLNSVEHHGDGLGLRALRTVMMPYFLNRKAGVQDSKYAPRLLFNRIWFLQSSERTQARIDMMACCNPSGKTGHCIARDMQNEHAVRSTKNILRGLHSQLGDIPVEKAVVGSNILELIDDHDRQAMLLLEDGGKTSIFEGRSEVEDQRRYQKDKRISAETVLIRHIW